VFIDLTCSCTNLSTSTSNLSTEISNLSTEINNLSTEINNLPTEINNLPTEINNLPTEISNLPTEINNLSTEINNLSTEINNLSTEISNLPPGMSGHQNIHSLAEDHRERIWIACDSGVMILDKTPAFHATWWACLCYVCLAIALLYHLHRAIISRMRSRQEARIAQIEKEKSDELARTKLRYFTNISHDLMTPLTIMSCLVDDIPHGARADILRSNINRLHRLLRQILDFRQIESGSMSLKVERADIIAFARRICERDFLPLTRRNNITLSFEAAVDNLPAYFDADKMDKVIFNLLSNAFKYTPRNGFIGVRLHLDESNGGRILSIEVSDTGIGIPAPDIHKVFTRFFNNNILLGETNGIGLSLTKEFVELHHGTITVKSIPGEGATFTVRVPIDREAYRDEEVSPVDAPPDEAEDPTREDEKEAAPRATILLVEDNDELARVIKKQLARDFSVLAASGGEKALQIVRDAPVDIVICDVMIPGMDGLDLCRAIKGNLGTSHLPVLLLTVEGSMDDRVACYDAGADGYISKPFEMKVLKACVNNLIAGRQKRLSEFKTNIHLDVPAFEFCSIDERFMKNVLQCIEEQLSSPDFDLEVLASRVNMSKSTLYRKMKSMTGLSPHEFIRNIKLKHACRLLAQKTITVAEVAYSVGFSNPKYFTICFKTEFGITPTEYQKEASPPSSAPPANP
jgi:signal transduction histidine kinase/DNA-binding response OmpR family regulator/uncharacterized protein YoxC